MNIEDALLPELRTRWDGRMLHHPLMVMEVFNCNHASEVNDFYCRKKQRLRDLKTKLGDGHVYVFLHERGYRFGALNRIVRRLSPTDYWRLVGEVWMDSENIRQNFAGWQRLWSAAKPNKYECMTTMERTTLASMPTSFPVWRGIGSRGRAKGLSWTLDRDKAVWFAQRFGGLGLSTPKSSGTASMPFSRNGESPRLLLPMWKYAKPKN